MNYCVHRMQRNKIPGRIIFWLLLAAVPAAPALRAQQQRDPRIGYAFPAGAQRGSVVEISVGGQYLEGTQGALISGSGVRVSLLKYNRPLQQKRFNELRDYLEETRKKMVESKVQWAEIRKLDKVERVALILTEAGATADEIQTFLEMRKQRSDPKRQQNAQLSENLILKVEVAPDAPTGTRELRLLSTTGASNPISFCVGNLIEQTGSGRLGSTLETAARVTLPAVINGWIPPGGIDHYSFQARRGSHLVIAVQARDLTPYLADAVPGWFQPVVTLYDAKGREVAYADHFRFSPDPLLCCDILEDGLYLLEIRDALYRGREDFVYRVTVGEIPFVTDIFPLGGRPGYPSTVEVAGWNLTRKKVALLPLAREGVYAVPGLGNEFVNNGTVFANDEVPQIMEAEQNNDRAHAQNVTLPVIVNGRIDPPGDVDVFAIPCQAGDKVTAETSARRLNSPLDSWIKVTDAAGKQIAFNDDFEDKGAGLQTHYADSRVMFTASARGLYYIQVGDAQGKGGPEYAYRLRISQPMPDFALRVVPSCINARPGAVVPVTVYALRRDGFNDDIILDLKDAPAGFQLDGGWIPAGQDKARATLTLPPSPPGGPTSASTPARTPTSSLAANPTSTPARPLTIPPAASPSATPVRPQSSFSASSPSVTPAARQLAGLSPATPAVRPPAGQPSVSPSVTPAVRPLAGAPAASPSATPLRPLAATPAPSPTSTPAVIPPSPPVSLTLEGHSSTQLLPVNHTATPADDRTQAFMYHHLVPAKEFLVVMTGGGRGRAPLKVVSHLPIKLPAGGTAKAILAATGGRAPFNVADIKLQLNDPPDGISIEEVTSVSEGAAISFKADRDKVKPGLKGNFIVETFTESTPFQKDGKPGEKRRFPSGLLPAIPFEIVSQ